MSAKTLPFGPFGNSAAAAPHPARTRRTSERRPRRPADALAKHAAAEVEAMILGRNNS